MPDHPPVTVLLPVYNEVAHIDECLSSLQAQDYPGPWTLLVAEGGSTDGTRERLARWQQRLPNLTIVENPQRLQTHGVNLAARVASTEILVRADGHTIYAPDYLRRSVEALLGSEAVAVGGLMRPKGRSPFGRAVAAAMTSPVAVGPGKFHYSASRQLADTAYLPAFRRADFLATGGYRTLPSGVGEDAELHHRWRRAGRVILLDPGIRSVYLPRETPGALWRQFYRYGLSKADMLYLNGRWPSWRPAAPLGLVAGLVGTAIGAVLSSVRWPFAALLGAWLALVSGAALRLGRGTGQVARVGGAMAIMHLSYGSGLLVGLLKGPRAQRAFLVAPSPHDASTSRGG
ncbi:MAG: glycosyltransferase family 2 protein [Actinomycetota bacterium]|nr:glycosyltransferase family 2 protein [Actinomycetota bacterium]